MPIPPGVTVFPLHTVEQENGEARCGCGDASCSRVGKHPAVGWRDLEPGEKIVREDGGGHGIVTGAKSGLFVVDCDGADALEEFVRRFGDVDTFTVETPRGCHLYFRHPDFAVKTSAGELGKGIDVRGEGGFVVAPGSPHRSGGLYVVAHDVPLADAPAGLLDAVKAGKARERSAEKNAPTPVDVESEEGKKRIDKAIVLAATYKAAVSGEGGSGNLWDLALELIRDYELPIPTAKHIVEEHYNPRCVPPWTEREILHKLEDARDRSDKITGAVVLDDVIERATRPLTIPATRKEDRRAGYSFDPARAVAAADRKKQAFTDTVFCLTSSEEWKGVLRWDVFRQRAFAVNPIMRMDAEDIWQGITESDLSGIRVWMETRGVTVGKLELFDAVMRACRAREVHPLRDWLDALPSVNTAILNRLAERVFGAADDASNLFLKMFLIAAAKRVYEPGCQVDTVLVLHGKQGAGKTSFTRALFGNEWVRSQIADLASKDASGGLQGFWCVELAELDRVMRAESSTVKEFLTRLFDDFRPPYGRVEQRFPRQCVFVGTTNEDEFLVDATGGRRYWPIHVESVDLAWLEANRAAIWAAARDLARAGARHWLDAEESETIGDKARSGYVSEDGWHDAIEDYCCGREWVPNEVGIFTEKLGGSIERLDRRVRLRISETLKRLGCKRGRKRVGGKALRVYYVPSLLRNEVPSEEENKRRAGVATIEKTAKLAKN